MTEKQIIEKWLFKFGKNVSEEILKNHVYKNGNFLWHIFSCGEAECLEGDGARRAFDELEYEKAIRFESGYASKDNIPHITKLQITQKISSDDLENEFDVYIVSEDFQWTYVHTHEECCGPFFVKKTYY